MHDKLVRLSLGKDFSVFEPYTIKFSDLPNIVCAPSTLYSPTQYRDSKRKSSNYLGFSDFLVLDFDEGWNDQHEQFFNNYIGWKVPTKSHLKEKNGIVCERYRILLLLDTPITLGYKDYKRLYKHIMKDLKLLSDTSCVDACRFYYSAQQPVENCIALKGTQCFQWEPFNYQDFKAAPLNPGQKDSTDITQYKGLDISYFENLHHSKRYPCPLCQMEGLDQKGHHMGFNKDEDYPTCFYDDEHSKILRKLYKQYKYGTIEDKIEDINDMVRMKCTPELIKVGINDPKPTNYPETMHAFYDRALDALEKATEVGLDIETFSEHFVDETLEECKARLSSNYKYIKGAYNAKCNEFKGIALDAFKNKIRIIGLACDTARVPFDMYYVTKEQEQRILNIIKDKFIVGHNVKFDIKSIMKTYGKEYCPAYLFDTMIASRMIHMAQDPEEQQAGHNLEATAFRFLNYKMRKDIEHNWGENNLTQRQFEYASDDMAVLLPIYREQVRQFKELYGPYNYTDYPKEEWLYLGPLVEEHPILALEMQTLRVVINIEFNGVKPNIPMMEKKIDHYNELIDRNDADLGINCGSSKQCVEFLQKYISKDITSSSSGVLEQYDYDDRVVKIIDGKMSRTRRGLMESMSKTNVHPYDGRIHPHFNQLLNTGRFACSSPNMQQIPKDIKNDIYMSSEDTLIYDVDYAAVEIRLCSVVDNDEEFLNGYKQNIDQHYATASKLFDKKIPTTHEEKEDAEKNPNTQFVNKWQRGFGKTANFSLIYGCHWTSFVAMIQASRQSDMTEQDIINMYNKFFDIHKGVKETIDTAKRLFMQGENINVTRWVRAKNGTLRKLENKPTAFFAVVHTLIGRKLTVDTERKMVNFPVQGSGADAIKLGITKMDYQIRTEQRSQKTINLVHDDTIAESNLYDFDKNSKMLRGALEWAINFVLKRKFHTPVDQDFCVLSLLGEEIFLEKAFTLKEIDEQLVARIKELLEKIEHTEDSKEKTDLTVEANRVHKLLMKFRDKMSSLNTEETQQIAN